MDTNKEGTLHDADLREENEAYVSRQHVQRSNKEREHPRNNQHKKVVVAATQTKWS